jgi:hypothetical protein
MLGPTPLTGFDMAAQRCRAALGNGSQDPRLFVRDLVGGAERRPIRPHDVGHFKPGPR